MTEENTSTGHSPILSPTEIRRCESYWRLWDRMIRAAEKVELARCKDEPAAAIQQAAEEKQERVLELGYHFEFCRVCQEWWRSFE